MFLKDKKSAAMKLRFKQTWGLLFLLFVTIAYLIIYLIINSPQKNEITEIYFADMMTAAHQILIDEYNKINEGKVKVIPIDFPNFDFSTNERKEMLARLLRGKGDGIDIFAVDLIWVQRFAKWSEPLNNHFTESEIKRILNVALESCYFEGELYGIPLDRVQGILYYRDDLLKKHKNYNQIIKKIENNLTWNDFINLKKELNITTPFYVFTGAEYEGLICIYMELLLSLNRNYFEQYGFNLNTSEAEKALQFLVDMVNKYKISPSFVMDFTEVPSYEYFIKNDDLFLRGWPSFDKDFIKHPFDFEKQKNLRKAAVPYFDSGKPSSILGGWNLMISKFSNKKTAAIDFAKYLISDASQEILYREGGLYPIIKSFYQDSQYVKKYPEIEKFKDWIQNGVHRPSNVEYTRYSKIMAYYINSALRMKLSVKEALSECTKDIQADKVLVKEYL
jgi:multiple sugar transport system substrate-binding protein